MRKSARVAFCGILSALTVVIMLLSYFPSFTYAIPATAGVLFAVIVIEIDARWAFVAYIATSILCFLFAEKEAALLFIFFFGYYPIIKGLIERRHSRPIEYGIKFAVFNVAIVIAYLLIINVFGIPFDDMGMFGKYAAWAMLIAGNVVFFVYDIAVSRLLTGYYHMLHPRIKRLFK